MLMSEYVSDQGEIIPNDELAILALSGLRASINAGYLTEERARNMFNHYFPKQVELFDGKPS